MDLTGKIAVITGANRGMGKAMTEKLSELGSTVYMVCRDEKRGRQAINELKGNNPKLKIILKIADMGKISDLQQLEAELVSETHHIDYLVNNAAVNVDKSNTRNSIKNGISYF